MYIETALGLGTVFYVVYRYYTNHQKSKLVKHIPSWSPISILWFDSLPAECSCSMSVERQSIVSELSWDVECDDDLMEIVCDLKVD